MHDATSEPDGSPIAKPATILLIAVMAIAYAALLLYTIPAAKECIFGQLAEGHAGIKSLAGCFKAPTIWPALLIAQAAVLLAVFEAFYGVVSKLVESVFSSDKKAALAVAAVVGVLTLFYLAKGDVLLGDAYLFQPAAQIFQDAMLQGMPHHTFYWYGGSSHFEYYGQLYFAAVAAANTIFGNINFTIKIANWLLHIIAAIALYCFAFELTKSRKAAFLSAIAYSVSYEHIARIMLHGRLVSSIAYALLPLLLLTIERTIKGKTGKATAIAGVALIASIIFLNNPGEGLFALLPVAAYFTTRLLQHPIKQQKKDCLKIGAAAALLFLILTSFWTVPFLLEKDSFNGGARVGELTGIKDHTSVAQTLGMFKQMVSFPLSGSRDINTIQNYLGLLQLFLAAIAIIYASKQKNKPLVALGIAGAAALLIMIWTRRYSLLVVLAIAPLAGAGAEAGANYLAKRLKGFTPQRLLIILLTLIIADSAVGLLQPYYPDFSDEKNTIAAQIPSGTGFRTLDLNTNSRSFYPSLTYLATKTESVFGTLLEGAPKSTNYAIAIATRAAKEYYDDKSGFSNTTLDGLYLFNARYVALHPEQIGSKGRNTKAALGLEKNITTLQLQNSPVIAAPNAEQYQNDELEKEENYFLRAKFEDRTTNYSITDQITSRMKLNRQAATADKILLKDAAPQASGNERVTIKSSVLETRHNRVRLKVEQSSDAFLQLSYSASPEIGVLVDGRKNEYYTTAISTIAIRTSKGEHTIDIVASPSKLRETLFFISAATAACLAGILAWRTRMFRKAFGRAA